MRLQRQISPAANFGVTVISKVYDVSQKFNNSIVHMPLKMLQTKIQHFSMIVLGALAFVVYYSFWSFLPVARKCIGLMANFLKHITRAQDDPARHTSSKST